MVWLVIILIILVAAPVVAEMLFPEATKALSDECIVGVLRVTSRFGSELTDEGRAEQNRWRVQRLRDLRGLSIRSGQRWRRKTS